MRRESVRPWVGLGVSVVACLATGAAPAAAQQPPAFPAGVELVRIDVVVLGKDGQPVTGLTAADFEVTEGGKAHEIASFEPVVVRSAAKAVAATPTEPPRVSSPVTATPAENRYFLIFFDDVHLTGPSAERVRAQLTPFLERETHDGDWLTIVAPLEGLRWTARTAYERQQLAAVVQSLKGQLVRSVTKGDPSDYEAMRIAEYGGGELAPVMPGRNASTYKPSVSITGYEVYAVAKRRIRQTMTGLTDAVASMQPFRGRKSLILYSEGFIKSPSMPDYQRAIELARQAHVTVYVIDPRGLGTGAAMFDGESSPTMVDLDTNAGGSTYVATSTGGRVSMSNDVTALFHEAALESTAYYLVGFQPAPGDTGERKLKIRVRRDGVTVRAPDRYFVGEPSAAAKPVPPAVRALGQAADATDIPLRVATLFLDASTGGQPTTTVAIEIPPVPGDSGDRQLTLLVEARSIGKGDPVRDTADLTLPPGDQPTVAARELHLHPGIWQARVVIRDPRTEKLGSVLHTFAVPEGAGLRVSSPVLGNKLERPASPRVQLRLDRHFLQTDSLYCQYHVFGAAPDPATHRPRVTGSFEVLRDGQPPQEGPASPIDPASDGEIQRLVGFKLSNFAPGDYTLVLRVTDQVSGQSREAREPFSVGG